MTKTVYLSGPIAGCTFAEATDWREYVADRLAPGLVAVSPMRGKAILRDLMGTNKFSAEGSRAYAHLLNCSPESITQRDRFDTTHAAAMLVNLLPAKGFSVGTCIELGWADLARVPIVAVLPLGPGPYRDHPIIRGVCGWIVETLDVGIGVVNGLLAPYAADGLTFHIHDRGEGGLEFRRVPPLGDNNLPDDEFQQRYNGPKSC